MARTCLDHLSAVRAICPQGCHPRILRIQRTAVAWMLLLDHPTLGNAGLRPAVVAAARITGRPLLT